VNSPTIRETVAVFDDHEKLETAVSALQSNGFDRAGLSFVAGEIPSVRKDPSTSHEPVVSDTDFRQERVLGTGLAATIAAFAAAGFVVATGGVVGVAAVAAAAAAGGVGAVGTIVGRKLAGDEESFLDDQLRSGKVLLCVRTPDEDAKRRAAEVLGRYAVHVRARELPAADIPGLEPGLVDLLGDRPW
jgi:hypothetical protein